MTTTPTDKRTVRKLRDKCGNPLGDWLQGTAKEQQLGAVTYFWPRSGATDILQKVALVTRIGEQVCAVSYDRPVRRSREALP